MTARNQLSLHSPVNPSDVALGKLPWKKKNRQSHAPHAGSPAGPSAECPSPVRAGQKIVQQLLCLELNVIEFPGRDQPFQAFRQPLRR